VQKWHFGNKIGAAYKRKEEQMRAMSERTRSLGM
jgi:hypothetical protein